MSLDLRTDFAVAAAFAAQIHDGQTRAGSALPYAIHLMETASIASTLTNDPDILTAALLHDALRKTGVTADDLRNLFGKRVAALVVAVGTEDFSVSWQKRKLAEVNRLRGVSREELILILADMLSELRAIDRVLRAEGNAAWRRFEPSNPSLQGWYFTSAAQSMSTLRHTDAYIEFTSLIRRVFTEQEVTP